MADEMSKAKLTASLMTATVPIAVFGIVTALIFTFISDLPSAILIEIIWAVGFFCVLKFGIPSLLPDEQQATAKEILAKRKS